MSLFYKCDCCGQSMHKYGCENGHRLHLDMGEQMDRDTSWRVDDVPLIRLDLCDFCYSRIVLRIQEMRQGNDLSSDLSEVSVNGPGA